MFLTKSSFTVYSNQKFPVIISLGEKQHKKNFFFLLLWCVIEFVLKKATWKRKMPVVAGPVQDGV